MREPPPPPRAGCPAGPALTEAAAEEHAATAAFRTGVPGFVGAEVEWLVRRVTEPSRRVSPGGLAAAVAAAGAHTGGAPAGPDEPGWSTWLRHGRLTVTAGGAVTVSTPPSPGVDVCARRTSDDLANVRRALRGAGLTPMNSALDPFRPPRRVLDSGRYAAMERYFDRSGPAGRWMMCSTASVRVCLDAGQDDDGPMGYRRRWALAHAIGPVLVAAFANSPLRLGRATGWKSTRQALWLQLDPTRVTPPGGGDPRAAWARYALDASVMAVRDDRSRWTVPAGVSFRGWLRSGRPRPATLADLDDHLRTLFPPVRPRGHLELRMIDGQLGDAWLVPLAVAAGLFGDARAGDEALAATERVHARAEPYHRGPWARAARSGLGDPVLAEAALACFMSAYEALGRQHASRDLRDVVAWFIERYVARGRSPADDVLDTVDEFA